MSLVLERKIKALEKRLKELEGMQNAMMDAFTKELNKVTTDKEIITKVLYKTMENYLQNNVEFSLSVDGQIKELINDESSHQKTQGG